MTNLNHRQFSPRYHQPEFDRFYGPEVTTRGYGGKLPGDDVGPRTVEELSLAEHGPDTKRGVVGEGQLIMNFDDPRLPLEHDIGGLIPVNQGTDPDWDHDAWRYGGHQRGNVWENPQPRTEMDRFSHTVVDGWGRAPVETIGPDDQVRTNQAYWSSTGRRNRVTQIDPDKVEMLREEGDLAFRDPETGDEEYPWIAEVANKRYLLEGHHRAIAARSRGTGEFPARVLRGGNWGQIEEQLYDGPRSR